MIKYDHRFFVGGFFVGKGTITLEVNLLDITISALSDNPKAVTKLERIYERERSSFDIFAKEKRLDISQSFNRIKAVILQKTETDILSAIGDLYTVVKNNVKKGLRFQQVATIMKPTDITKQFAIYKFFELLLGKWKEFDDYEKKIIALIYHDINKTKLRDFDVPFSIVMEKDVSKRSMVSAFCGSSQLYGYIYGLLLHSGMSMEDMEKTKLIARDYEDISYEMAELMEANKRYGTEKDNGQLVFDITESDSDHFQTFTLMAIGIIVKVFIKRYQQQQKELAAVKPKETIIVKEDLESKKKLKDKQDALNKLQMDYDKQQRRLTAVTEELKTVREYVDIIEKIQEMEEQQKENDPNAKPTIPYGKGIILFGGHPNYQKKMIEKYNWIKVVSPEDIRVDWNIVKNASLILINWKHLPHRQFYSLISVIREYKKEYQYVW